MSRLIHLLAKAANVKLDDLDQRLLSSFAASYPRPRQLSYCDYDVDVADMHQLCIDNRAYENAPLIANFVSHNRLGMWGDWRDFPAFAGDVAVHARRSGFDNEFDLLFFYLHTSACGDIADLLFPLLREWVADVLMPWTRPLVRTELFIWDIHVIGYLGIYCNVGGDPIDVIRANVQHARETAEPTSLLRSLHNHVLRDADPIYRHFSSARRAADNQELPSPSCRVVPVKHVKRIHAAIDAARADIENLGGG